MLYDGQWQFVKMCGFLQFYRQLWNLDLWVDMSLTAPVYKVTSTDNSNAVNS